jgi:hypothetical protein
LLIGLTVYGGVVMAGRPKVNRSEIAVAASERVNRGLAGGRVDADRSPRSKEALGDDLTVSSLLHLSAEAPGTRS